jgi:hypothetical protein
VHADPALTAALAAGLNDAPAAHVAGLAAYVAQTFGQTTLAVVHYGSRAHGRGATGSDPRPESADDFFVIVADYDDAYRSARIGRHGPRVAAALNRVLPPNVVAVSDRKSTRLAKCAVLSEADLARACSSRAHDHFVRARLFQQVQFAWSRDNAARAIVSNAIVAARAGTFDWVRPYLPASFDALGYCRTMLETSFAAEIRPEGGARLDVLLGAQDAVLVPMYDALLADLASRNVLTAVDGGYGDPHPPGSVTRLRWAMYFRRSKIRATARWAKYIALYDDWLEYVLQKVARRSGTTITLTPRERRWPLLFLWPKAFRYMRSRPQRRAGGRA